MFRKSDVSWNGLTRGWEVALSYSFATRITSGFAKGTKSAQLGDILENLTACAVPAAHPLLLPVLILNNEISAPNDKKQRESREKVRRLEKTMSSRYATKPAPGYETEADLELDQINRKLTDCHCEVLWKRPQAWRSAVSRLQEAAECYWSNLPQDQKVPELEKLHNTLLCRLKFIDIKLDGLDNFAHVSLERLNLQREVVSVPARSRWV